MPDAQTYLGCDALTAFAQKQEAESPHALHESAHEYPRPKGIFRDEELMRRLARGRPRVYGEGDSWFDFPGLLVPGPHNDILDTLAVNHDYAVVRRSDRGDTLSNMRSPENLQLLASEMARDQPKAFLLSGGGNDLFGGGKECRSALHDMLRPKADTDGRDLIDPARLHATADRLISDMRLVVQPAVELGIPVLLHGYAAPAARVLGRPACRGVAGPWIEPVLRCRGYDPQADGPPILDKIVDNFNERVSAFAQTHPLLHYIDLRPVVRAPHWRDELHLKAEGWVAVAAAMHDRLDRMIT